MGFSPKRESIPATGPPNSTLKRAGSGPGKADPLSTKPEDLPGASWAFQAHEDQSALAVHALHFGSRTGQSAKLPSPFPSIGPFPLPIAIVGVLFQGPVLRASGMGNSGTGREDFLVRLVPLLCLVGATGILSDPARGSENFAGHVVSYSAGTNADPTYADPAAALGSPTRYTGVQFGFAGAVTPFNPPFDPGDIVSIGRGGSLVVSFDHAITNDASHRFGIDFLVFGNAFFIDNSYPSGIVGGTFGRIGDIAVSSDGQNWTNVTAAAMGPLFPTLGYSDLTDPYSTSPGAVNSDFSLAVDPSFNPLGHTFAEVVAAYAGSGGGQGIDIGALGLSSVSYIRVTNSGAPISIDAFSAVPAPASVLCLVIPVLSTRRRRA